MAAPLLLTPRLTIRPFTLADAPRVQQLAGDRAIADTTMNIPHPYDDGMAAAWIAEHSGQFQRGEIAHFAVVLRERNEVIGAVGLTFHHAHARAELGYWIGREYWSLGYGTEAARAMLEYAFLARGQNRVEATHFSRNPSSGRVMQKLGMKHEGRSRQYFKKADTFEDVERYAILRDEYLSGR
jgi:RimJ/RimL family protein N-acetyltransferase